MTDRPIIFSAPMVRALIEGRKTQTRRIVKFRDYLRGYSATVANGDWLWVREVWAVDARWNGYPPREVRGPVCYKAGSAHIAPYPIGRWRSPIHMPRWASRLTLVVTDLRVQRLQEISEDDARAEGVKGNAAGPWGCEGLIEDFADLWDNIHGSGAWDKNPWVCAISFRCIQKNIDSMP